MTNRELLAWCALAFVLGVLCGLMLSNAQRPPQPPRPCADAQPDTDAGQGDPTAGTPPGKVLEPFREIGRAAGE